MARLLPVTMVACAGAVALAAAAAFVTLPGSRPSAQQLRQPRASPAQQLEALDSALPEPATQPAVEEGPSALKWLSAGMLAGAVMAACSAPAEALDDKGIAIRSNPFAGTFTIKAAKHLELCKNNKKYNKKWKDKNFKLDSKIKKYPKDTAVYGRLIRKKAANKRRQDAYGERICAKNTGIPETIASGEFVRGGIIPPALAFLYITGWIGWAGRSYLRRKASREQEIILDVPLALTCMASGFAWPVYAWQEIVNGEMTQPDSEFYDSHYNNNP